MEATTTTTTAIPTTGPRFPGDTGRLMLGMSVTDSLSWENACTLLGIDATAGLETRRVVTSGWITPAVIAKWADWAEVKQIYPIISFKVPNNNWAGVLKGTYDNDLKILANTLLLRSQAGRMPVCVSVCCYSGDWTAWALMQTYLSNFFAPYRDVFTFTTLSTGYQFGPHISTELRGQISVMYPNHLIDALNENGHILGCNTYDTLEAWQMSYRFDRTSTKIQGFLDWAESKCVQRIGIGEFGCHNGADISKCWDVLSANDQRFAFANYFNSGNRDRDWRLDHRTKFSVNRLVAARKMFVSSAA